MADKKRLALSDKYAMDNILELKKLKNKMPIINAHNKYELHQIDDHKLEKLSIIEEKLSKTIDRKAEQISKYKNALLSASTKKIQKAHQNRSQIINETIKAQNDRIKNLVHKLSRAKSNAAKIRQESADRRKTKDTDKHRNKIIYPNQSFDSISSNKLPYKEDSVFLQQKEEAMERMHLYKMSQLHNWKRLQLIRKEHASILAEKINNGKLITLAKSPLQ